MTVLRNLIVTIILIGLTACGNSSSNETEDSKSTNLKVETPPLKKETVDLGKLKMNQDGNSVGNKTELTKLEELTANKDIDLIEINWIWDSSPKYDDMEMKITYDKMNADLKLIYVKNNVKEEYSNVFVDCLLDYLRSGEKGFYGLEKYCKDSKYDFNNREMTNRAVGEKPKQSELTGSVSVVENFVKSNAYDASSIDFLEWSKVSSFGEYWIVRAKYKGTNAVGGVVTENTWFYIQNGEVIKTKPIN